MGSITNEIIYPVPLKKQDQICLVDPANAYTDEAAGIIVGDLTDCDIKDRPGTAMEAVADVLKDVKCPVIYGVRAGHIGDSLTLPLHAKVQMKAVQGEEAKIAVR